MTTRRWSPAFPGSVNSQHWLPILGLTLLALLVRLPGFFDGFYGDESFTYDDVVHRTLADAMGRVREYEDTPPLFFLIVWGAAKVGDPAVWLRIPSLVFGIGLVPVAYCLGTRLAGRKAALLGAGLVALSPFAVRFSTEARAYSLLAFLAVSSTLALVIALDHPNRRGPWVAFALLTVGTLYVHYTAFFLLAAQASWAFGANRREWRHLVAAYGISVLAVAPWMLTRLPGHGDSFQALYPFTADAFYKYWAQSIVGSPQVGIQDVPGTAGWYLLAALALVAVAGWVLSRGLRLSRLASGEVLLLLLALAAPMGVVVYSAVATSVVAGRNMFVSAPFALLLVGVLLSRLRPAASALGTGLAVAALVVGLVIASEDRFQRPAWKQAAGFVDARAEPTDPVVLGDPFGPPGVGDREVALVPMRLYLNHPETLVGLFAQDSEAFARLEPRGRVFVVVPSYIGGLKTDPPQPGRRFELEDSEAYEGLTPITVYAYRRDVAVEDGVRLVRRTSGDVLVRPDGTRSPLERGRRGGFLEGVAADEARLTASGWAVDPVSAGPAEEVLLFDGTRLLGRGRPTRNRPDIAASRGRDAARSGFEIETLTGRAESLVRTGRVQAVGTRGRSAWLLGTLGGAFTQPAD